MNGDDEGGGNGDRYEEDALVGDVNALWHRPLAALRDRAMDTRRDEDDDDDALRL